MLNNLKDQEYYELNKISYDDKILNKGNSIEIKNEAKWKVIDSIDNKKSGLQGAALVPAEEYEDITSGKQEPSNMVFVSRGTNNLTDWECNFTDLGSYPKPSTLRKIEQSELLKKSRAVLKSSISLSVIKKFFNGATSTKNNQFVEYEDFVNATVKKYKPKDYSFTGHSLGGALAQYTGVLHGKRTVTYSAARAYRLLPSEYQNKVLNGDYNNLIFNYRHEGDIVGYVPFGKIIGTSFNVQPNIDKKGFLGIPQHLLTSFEGMFTSNGAIKLLVKSEEVRDVLNKLRENLDYIDRIIYNIKHRMDTLDYEAQRVYNELLNKLESGEFI